MTKVVLFGYGSMAKNHHRVLSQMGVPLSAIVEQDAAKHQDGDVPFYRTIDDLLEKHGHFDVALVVTSSVSHHEVVEAIHSHCQYIFVEKPALLKDDLFDALEGKLFVGYIERFNPAVVTSKKIVDSGQLGQIKKVCCTRVGGPPRNKIQAINVIWDLAIHDLSIVESLIGQAHAYELLARKTDADGVITSALLGHWEEELVTIDASWDLSNKKRSIEIYCENGLLILDLAKQMVLCRDADIKLANHVSLLSPFAEGSASSELHIGVQNSQPLENQLTYFLELVKTEATLPKQSRYKDLIENL